MPKTLPPRPCEYGTDCYVERVVYVPQSAPPADCSGADCYVQRVVYVPSQPATPVQPCGGGRSAPCRVERVVFVPTHPTSVAAAPCDESPAAPCQSERVVLVPTRARPAVAHVLSHAGGARRQ